MYFSRKKFLTALSAVLICGLLFPGISEAASYTVKSGDSLWAIANRYKTTVAQLQQLNNIKGSLIFPGQVLRMNSEPAQNTTPPAAQPSQPSAPSNSTYTVKSGDSLWVIANRHNTTVAKLQQLNNITGSLIYPGQVLRVNGTPAQNTTPPATKPSTPEPSAPSSSTYTVKSGDSLWVIANRYGLTVNKLMSLNNLTGTIIYPGQVLKVGQTSQTPPSRSGSSDKIIQTAYRFLGVPYVWAGTSPSGFDCSGFVKYVYSLNGITLPRVACDQANAGTKIQSMSQLQRGDLVCFSGSRNGYVDHIGIYVGNNQVIHASSSARRIVVSSLSGSWYQQTFVRGVRIL